MKPKVLLTVPNGSGWIHMDVHMALVQILADPRVVVTHDCPKRIPYVHNLHMIQREFLAGDYDFWITMDDDNPPKRNVVDLVFLDLDVIGCPTPVWHNDQVNHPGDRPWYHNSMDDIGDEGFKPLDAQPGFNFSGLHEVGGTGSGCMVIARRVLEAIKAPFMRTWREDGTAEISGDFSFSRRARDAGFRIWSHFDYMCGHYVELDLSEVIHAFSVAERGGGRG